MTPEEMDKVEAAYRVEREWWGMLAQRVVMSLAAIQGIDLSETDTEGLRHLDFCTD